MPRSMQRMDFICPNCGHTKNMIVDNLTSKGFHCDYCKEDGISYPNRMLRSFLKQVSQYLDEDYQLEKYIAPYKFDGYFIYNSQPYAVEMHGLQHYEQVFSTVTLEEQQQRDEEKRHKCCELGIIEIEIDCRISDFDYIKTNLYKSKLSDLFDFSKIDWLQLREDVSKNIVKEVADLAKKVL